MFVNSDSVVIVCVVVIVVILSHHQHQQQQQQQQQQQHWSLPEGMRLRLEVSAFAHLRRMLHVTRHAPHSC